MSYPCLYKATVCYYDGDAKDSVTEVMHGIIYADSFADAASQIEKYYGEDLIALETELFEDGASELMEADAFAAVEIMDMLSVLDEEEKQIVLLRLYQEMPYREIAEVMGIKIFAAQKRYQRAISKLKKYNPR